MKKQLNGDNGRLLILEVTIGDAEYRLANIYNANTEQFQLKTLQNLSTSVESFDNFYNKNEILAGDLISFSITSLNEKREDQYLKTNQ